MTPSTSVKLGCLAALVMAVSLPGWSATRFLVPDEQPLGSVAPLVLSNPDLHENKTKGYRPWFENGSWQGDLVEYTVTDKGVLSTSVDFSGLSPVNGGNKANWSALAKFADTIKTNPTYWNSPRKIITFNSSSKMQVPFRFTDDGIGTANMALLAATPPASPSAILDFVRGDPSNENSSSNPNGTMRRRLSILGDIIHSKPEYVGKPNDTRTEHDYSTWAKEKANREPRVYVGANDGMLHVFDAATGAEVYAYVPSMLIPKLPLLTKRPYVHKYFVDGEMSVRDAYFNGAWHTVLAGSLGAGGKGFFILDITDPDLFSETSTESADIKVLFEHTTSATSLDNDLGDSFSRPVIAKLNDGHWYVVVGNGYNSVNGEAVLYLVNLDTFAVTKITTDPAPGSGSAGVPNGLSSPSLLDVDRNGTADIAYAGDIDGNLWKFDLSSATAGNWKVAYGEKGLPLHPTAGNQAIIHAPQITLHPQYGYLVHFATGRMLTAGDLTDTTSIQSLYAIWDSGQEPPSKPGDQKLLAQTWDGPYKYNYTIDGDTAAVQTIAIFNPDKGSPNWNTPQHGWKVDFPAGGFRVLQPIQVRANRVKATVYRPVEEDQGENWLVEAVLQDGGPNPTTSPIYDLNVDGALNADDLYTSTSGTETAQHVPMMWQQVKGIMSQVTIANIANGVDVLFINYLQPDPKPCTGDLCFNYIPPKGSGAGFPATPAICPLCAGQIPLKAPGGSTGAGQKGDGGDGSITEGNMFLPGRMSWTDIVN